MTHGSENKPHEAFESWLEGSFAKPIDIHKPHNFSVDTVLVVLAVGRGLLAVAKEIYELRCMLAQRPTR